MAALSQLTDAKAKDFANKVGNIFTSVPHLPKEWVAFLVKIAPICAMIGAVLMVLSGLSFGMYGIYGLVSLAVSLGSASLLFLAYKPLQEKKAEGWMYLFWSTILETIGTVMMAFLSGYFFGILGIIVGMYILFEMRPSYK